MENLSALAIKLEGSLNTLTSHGPPDRPAASACQLGKLLIIHEGRKIR
ncbi:hypothetical protein [Variovorax paradoxus]